MLRRGPSILLSICKKVDGRRETRFLIDSGTKLTSTTLYAITGGVRYKYVSALTSVGRAYRDNENTRGVPFFFYGMKKNAIKEERHNLASSA